MNYRDPMETGGYDDRQDGKAHRSPFEGYRVDRSDETRAGVIGIAFQVVFFILAFINIVF